MNAIKVDDLHRIQLAVLEPGDLYEPEIISNDEITLHRVTQSSVADARPALVKVEKRQGFSVGISDQSISADAINEALAEFP